VIAAAALLLGLLAPTPADTVPGDLAGEVRAEATGEALVAATVQLYAGSAWHTTTADADGRYEFHRVAPGRALLRAVRLDREPLELEVLVPEARVTHVELHLRPRTIPLAGLRVGAPPLLLRERTGREIPVDAPLGTAGGMELTPGIAEAGLGAPEGEPPGEEPLEPSEALFVRGSTADLKLILLDGAPVYTPFHLTGLMPPFSPELLEAAELHVGGARARYDGGLSYILEVTTRRDSTAAPRATTAALDVVSSRFAQRGEVSSSVRYLAGGRALHRIGVRALTGDELPYEYAEGLARLDFAVGSAGTLSVTGFANGEGVRFAPGEGSAGGAEWGNSALASRYRGSIGGVAAEVTAAVSSYRATLNDARREPLLGGAERARVLADLSSEWGGWRLFYGAGWDRTVLRTPRGIAELASPDAPPLRVSGDAGAGYLEAAGEPLGGLRVRGGVRAAVFFRSPEPRLSPRLSASWRVAEGAVLDLGAGRYHQYVRVAQPGGEVDAAAADDPAANLLAVGGASHFTAGLRQDLAPVRLGVQGFLKRFDAVAAATGDGSDAYASGVDIWARREADRLSGYFAYSLTWLWSDRTPGAAPARFAGRQVVSAGATGSLPRWGDLELRFAWGSGLPLSAVPAEASGAAEVWDLPDAGMVAGDAPTLAGSAAESYLRLDVKLSRTFTPRWGERRHEIVPYLRVLNALDRRDALFYRYAGADEPRLDAVGALPLLPVVGVGWSF
jgi:hypothetical protein